NQRGLSRKHIFESVAHSLRCLELDYLDVLQCEISHADAPDGHWFDDSTPIEETMRALHDVVQTGHARYIRMSSGYAWQFHMMQNYVISNGLTPFISMQYHYCMLCRKEEVRAPPLDWRSHFGVGSVPWSPLARVPDLSPARGRRQQKGRSIFLLFSSLLFSVYLRKMIEYLMIDYNQYPWDVTEQSERQRDRWSVRARCFSAQIANPRCIADLATR
ncbi:Aldo/keto reductase, partial [Athelia psychrophila]